MQISGRQISGRRISGRRISGRKVAAPADDAPVTTLELFFDLVFVFVITRLTDLVTGPHGWVGYGHAALVLIITWWMYDGFCWLANNVPPLTPATQLPMLAAMTCFLAIAVVVPDAFGSGAWIFAGAYLVVVTIHALQFFRSSLGGSAEAMRAILPVNYGVSGLLVLAAVLGHRWGWVCWVGAVLVLGLSLAGRRESGFAFRTDHFAERHGQLVLIALGETIVAVGVSAEGSLTHPSVGAAALLAMAEISALWWVYFGTGDDGRGARAIDDAPAAARTTLALRAYSVLHLLHIAGLVGVAVALHTVVHAPTHHLSWGLAVTGSGGAALFLGAQAAFRRMLRLGPAAPLLLSAVGLLALTPVGVVAPALVELLVAGVVLAAGAVALRRSAPVAVD